MDNDIKNTVEYAKATEASCGYLAAKVEKKDRALGEKLRKAATAAKEVVKHIEGRTDPKNG